MITSLICIVMLFFAGRKVEAAFPYNMEQKPVKAVSLQEGTIPVYSDKQLQNKKGELAGNQLKIEAYKVSGSSIYGNYKSGENTGTGWFSLDTFVVNPQYKNIYATVRDAMYIYTDSSFSKVQTKIKKYSGIIVISKLGEKRQVICDKKDHYEIGWMTSGAFSNTLLYDGREKQTLADGIYEFRCNYLDDENGGSQEQSAMDNSAKYTFKIMYLTRNKYYIQNTEDGKYLAVKAKNDKSYTVKWTDEPDEIYGQFQLQRYNGSYTIQNVKNKYFLAEHFTLEKGRDKQESHWRIHATQKMSNTKKPFVFTQYDPEWCATPYGGGGCMGTAGCGILATVNAVYALSGQYMDVMELANYAVEKNYRIVGSGTDDGIFKAAAKKYGQKYGFAWDGKSGSIDVLKKKLKAGDTAVVHVQGHYVAISDYNKNTKKYLLLDSNYLPKRATSAFGDWIKVDRLLSGALESQCFYFFKQSKM